VLKRIASALKPDGIFLMLRILVEVISDSGERDQVPRPRTLESVTLL